MKGEGETHFIVNDVSVHLGDRGGVSYPTKTVGLRPFLVEWISDLDSHEAENLLLTAQDKESMWKRVLFANHTPLNYAASKTLRRTLLDKETNVSREYEGHPNSH